MGESLKAMVLEGHGIAWLPESSIAHELNEKRVVPVGNGSLQMTIDICMYRSIQKTRPQLMQFWSCAESLASQDD